MCTVPGCPGEQPHQINRQIQLTGLSQCPTSSDCGFFCGMALKLLYEGNGNPEARPVSRLEVYRLREDFLQTPPKVFTHRHGRDLGPDAPLLLTRTMRLAAYRAAGGVPGIWQRMAGYIGSNARFGAMFADLAGGSGHWAAVLGVRGSGTRQEFRVYDPSWAIRNLDWLPAAQAAQTYAGIQMIVSTAGP